MFLTLMGQEEYVNPYTKEIEIATENWKHRWVSKSRGVIYNDSEEYNPKLDVNLKRSDYKRTPIHKQFPPIALNALGCFGERSRITFY